MTTRTSQFPIVTPAAYRGPADQASLTKLKWGFRVGAVLLAAASNWVNRFAMGVDGISYLDMAYAYMRGQWKIAINPYWGAGYSWLLGAFLVPFHVSPYWESTVVHLVNVLVFVLALFAFEYLLAGVIQYRSLSRFSGTGLDPWTWWTIGYVLFLAVHTFLVPVTGVTPDLCVDVILFVAAGIIVRIASGSDTLRAYTVLGAILALGYLIKAPMFPMGLVFLAAGWLASPRRRQALARSAVGCAVFLLLCSPFILAISLQLGRPTIGEAGRVTYAHYALGVNDVSYWQGQYAGMGTPRHPDATRKLMDNPDVYAFSTKTGGTLPPYYNPGYWGDGLKIHLDFHGQMRALRTSAAGLMEVFYYMREYVLVFLLLLFAQESGWGLLRRLWVCWFLWAPGVVALAMYAPLLIETRYIGGYVLLFCLALMFALDFPPGVVTTRLLRAAALSLLVLGGYRMLHDPSSGLRESVPPTQWKVANALGQRGIRPGEKVAEMLFHTRDTHYWAHLAGVQIVAEVPFEDEDEFWSSSPERQRRVEQLLKQAGATMLVTENVPSSQIDPRWQHIPGTDYAVFPLEP